MTNYDIKAKYNNNAEIATIKQAMKDTSSKRMYQRYMVILHHLQGYTNKDIASRFDLCAHTVGTYVKKYKLHKLIGLELKHSSGAPRKISKEQEIELVEVISTKTPDEVGFAPMKNWTISIIGEWIENNFDIKYSHRGVAEVLYRLNLSYTRPTYTLAKADSQKQESFRQEFEVLKKIT